MAYPDSLLADDERVVKHLHPHWITLVWPVLLLIVIVGLGSFLAAIFPGGSLQTPGRIAIGVVGVIALSSSPWCRTCAGGRRTTCSPPTA